MRLTIAAPSSAAFLMKTFDRDVAQSQGRLASFLAFGGSTQLHRAEPCSTLRSPAGFELPGGSNTFPSMGIFRPCTPHFHGDYVLGRYDLARVRATA